MPKHVGHVRVLTQELVSGPWRARWYCAGCGSVVAAIPKGNPKQLLWAESSQTMDIPAKPGDRLKVLRYPLDDPEYGDPPEWLDAWCCCGSIIIDDVREVLRHVAQRRSADHVKRTVPR